MPDWIDVPIPDQHIHPMDDAIGKLIVKCQWLELWMTILYGQLVEGMTAEKAHKTDITTQITDLMALDHAVPEKDRSQFTAAMSAAREIVELRNGIVHGMYLPNDAFNPTFYQAQRRNKRGERRFVDFNREVLIGAAEKAWNVGGFIQSHSGRWPRPNPAD